LAVDPKAAQGRATERIIVDLLGETLDGKSVGVLVFADDGYLTESEVYDLEGHESNFVAGDRQSAFV
jgi:hypothetical protein